MSKLSRKKAHRFVPIRVVGKPDRKPRQLCRRNLLSSRAMNYPNGIEWFDQPARKWRRVNA